jgi:hypothetical protein
VTNPLKKTPATIREELDQASEESFPASDPPAAVQPVEEKSDDEGTDGDDG